MKKIKSVIFILILTVLMLFSVFANGVYAADTRNVQITKSRHIRSSSGVYNDILRGYGIQERDISSARTHPIYELLSKDSGGHIISNDLYCVNSNYGVTFNQQDRYGTAIYHRQYDLANKTELKSQLSSSGYTVVVRDDVYGPLMWILDNIYVVKSATTDEETTNAIRSVLSNAGIKYGRNPEYPSVQKDMYYYEGKYLTSYGIDGYRDDEQKDVVLTADIIQAVQQAAIWYFTNYTAQGENTYNNYNTNTKENQWLQYITASSDMDKENPDDYLPLTKENKKGAMLQEQASILYNYLVDGAKAAGKDYTSASKASLKLEGNTIIQESGSNYVIGPIKATVEGTASNLTVKVKTGASYETDISSNITLQSRVDGGTISSIKENSDFYVSVPKANVNGSVRVSVTADISTTKKTLWADNSQAEQPIVEVEKQTEQKEANVEVTPRVKMFDLALRKQIISVNGENNNLYNEEGLPAQRSLDANPSSISDTGTATYKHRKDPIVVKEGDIVTYRISIYNEGDINGYASKIIDQLPTGLVFDETMGATVVSSKGNTYKITYTSNNNQVLLEVQGNPTSIPAYVDTLQCETIDIKCKVKQKAETDGETSHYLTNIAYIAEAKDSEGNKIDRDRNNTESQPTKSPNKTTDELNNTDAPEYKGDNNNQSVYDDSNNEYYYKGEEDDDDFEILTVLPKEFDLKLMKYISEVNGEKTDRTITEDITDLASGKKTTAKYNVSKEPILVETGDYVTYTFRIYNEGEINGYASKITEDIPEGLQFTTVGTTQADREAIEYNNQMGWTLDEGGKTVSTNYLSTEDKLIKAFNGKKLDSKEVSIKFKVITTDVKKIVRNEAAITEDLDEDKKPVNDRDSKPEDWNKDDEEDDFYDDNPDYPKYKEDDEDYDNIKVRTFDLALRKYISKVSSTKDFDEGTTSEYNRAPQEDVSKLNEEKENGEIETTAEYKHSKQPLLVDVGDYILYTIRVYNEGDIDGYAKEIVDILPEYLDFVDSTDSYINSINSKWTYNPKTREVRTTALENRKLLAFNGGELDSADVQIICKVNENVLENAKLTNIAEITKYADEKGPREKDRDSQQDNFNKPDDVPGYKDEEINKQENDEYIPGQEDDDDFEKVIVRAKAKYNLQLIKQDKDGEELDSTAKFKVATGTQNVDEAEEVEVTGHLIIAQDVEINKNNVSEKDIYTIKETQAPDGYCEFGGIIKITVNKGISEDGKKYEVKSADYEVVDEQGNTMETEDAKVYVNDEGNIFVTVKDYEEPEIHKGVKDVENQDSGYNGEEEQEWVINTSIPSDIEKYKEYEVVDDIDYRLNFLGEENVTVKIGETTLEEKTDYILSYEENANGVQEKTNSGTLKITFINDTKQISDNLKQNKEGIIEIRFKTEFAKDEDGKLLAQMGVDVENQAILEYTNGSKVQKEKKSETPEVHTGGVTLFKYYDENGDKVALEGVEFAIYANEQDAINKENELATATSEADGIVRFLNLQYGEDANDDDNNITQDGTYEYDSSVKGTAYWISEIAPLDGYVGIDTPIEVTINKDSYIEDIELIENQIENKKIEGSYNVILVKQDKDGEQLNEKAKFKVAKGTQTLEEAEEVEVTGRLTIAEDVKINGDNVSESDTYMVQETQAPDKYCEFDGIINITVNKRISEDETKYEVDSVDYTVLDSEGNVMETQDATVYLNDDGNIYVEVKDYEEPEIHKGVKDVENQDSGYNGEEEQEWVVTVNIPGDIEKYKEYSVEDDIDYRLNFLGEENVVVKIGETTLEEGTDYILSYEENENGVQEKTNSGHLSVIFINDTKQISDNLKQNKEGIIEIRFKTEFAKDEDGKLLAQMGVDVENQAILEYTNGSNIKEEKKSETPEVHTGGVTLFKYYDENGKKVALEGVEFAIYANEQDAKNKQNELATASSEKDGIVRFTNLQYGEDANDDENNKTQNGTYEYNSSEKGTEYWIAETKALEGYTEIKEPIKVVLNKDSYIEDIELIPNQIENKKEIFDLALLKYVSKVIVTDNGTTTTTKTGNTGADTDIVPKVEINKKRLKSTVVKFEYVIKITNEGEIEGYATEITDYVPNGLKFYSEDNKGWKEKEDGVITTDLLKDKLLQPGESATVTVVFRWINGSKNLGVKTNVAEISKDKNQWGVHDRDSIPGNKAQNEDDIDDAQVLLSIKTGLVTNILKYVSGTLVILVVLAGGIVLIKRYVL